MGIMSEAELHVLRARLAGGIRNKAARGELRRGLPVGLIWGEADGEILRHPDERSSGVIGAVFSQFAVAGSARAVWLWLKDQHLRWPLQQIGYRRGSAPRDHLGGADLSGGAHHADRTRPTPAPTSTAGPARSSTSARMAP